jgi:signal transduction histidine kinase
MRMKQNQQSQLELKRTKAACAKSARRHRQTLGESIELQKHLRELTHRVLAAQEAERLKLSHELQDEIAQTLLGINVRLLALKKQARAGAAGLKNEITRTQRLVLNSARSVRRYARELELPLPA